MSEWAELTGAKVGDTVLVAFKVESTVWVWGMDACIGWEHVIIDPPQGMYIRLRCLHIDNTYSFPPEALILRRK